ncbi:MAG: hypothetical protein AB7K09_05705 [Planctomycetota bacterium]
MPQLPPLPPAPLPKPGPLAPVALFGTCVAASAVLGAVTNAINGSVSPTYFVTILRWQGVQDVWRACIAQGVFEGLATGVLLGLIVTVATGWISAGRMPAARGVVLVLKIAATAAVLWVVGGLIAMGLATLSPEFYRRAFIGVPEEPDAMLRYAWVGGSIQGVQFGGFVATIVWLVIFRSAWLNEQRPAAGPDEAR